MSGYYEEPYDEYEDPDEYVDAPQAPPDGSLDVQREVAGLVAQRETHEAALAEIENMKEARVGARGRGDTEAILAHTSTVAHDAVNNALEQGFRPEAIAEALQSNPALVESYLEQAAEETHWSELIGQIKRQVNPTAERYRDEHPEGY